MMIVEKDDYIDEDNINTNNIEDDVDDDMTMTFSKIIFFKWYMMTAYDNDGDMIWWPWKL